MHERLMTLRNSPSDSKLQSKIQTGAKFITICLAILHTVAYKCQRTKNILLHEQVPDLVVNTIQLVPNNDKLSCYAVRLLKVLSVAPTPMSWNEKKLLFSSLFMVFKITVLHSGRQLTFLYLCTITY